MKVLVGSAALQHKPRPREREPEALLRPVAVVGPRLRDYAKADPERAEARCYFRKSLSNFRGEAVFVSCEARRKQHLGAAAAERQVVILGSFFIGQRENLKFGAKRLRRTEASSHTPTLLIPTCI